jgi:hypothetical protein
MSPRELHLPLPSPLVTEQRPLDILRIRRVLDNNLVQLPALALNPKA